MVMVMVEVEVNVSARVSVLSQGFGSANLGQASGFELGEDKGVALATPTF